jgi:predicted permease
MALLIGAGGVWRFFKPQGLGAVEIRNVVTNVVYYYFLPAMILNVLWQADIGVKSLYFMLLTVSSISVAIACAWLIGKLFRFENHRLGAVILAAAFGNVTYLGLPILEQVFGSWARSVAIQIDLFACAPYLFTFGIMIARHYGEDSSEKPKSVFSFLNTPPFWAMAVAIVLNINDIIAPPWFMQLLQKLSGAVIPLMLFSLGLALSWTAIHWGNMKYLVTVVIIKLMIMPLFALWLVNYLPLETNDKAAAILDIAMPCMLIGVVLCDRYRLDSYLYAMIVTISTAISALTLPFWYSFLITL